MPLFPASTIPSEGNMAIPKNDGERFDHITTAINVLNGKVEALIALLSVTPMDT
jgi:hypothetical protein